MNLSRRRFCHAVKMGIAVDRLRVTPSRVTPSTQRIAHHEQVC
jgi:hypothetical protein